MNLYQINEAIETTFSLAVDQSTGEIDEEKLYLLDLLEIERSAKIENIALLIKNLRAEAVALKTEKEVFQKRQKQTENKVNSLMNYLESALNGEKFSTDKCAISWRRSSKIVLNEGCTIYDIDTHFLRMSEPELDKVAIKAALKDGLTVEGVHEEPSLSMTLK